MRGVVLAKASCRFYLYPSLERDGNEFCNSRDFILQPACGFQWTIAMNFYLLPLVSTNGISAPQYKRL